MKMTLAICHEDYNYEKKTADHDICVIRVNVPESIRALRLQNHLGNGRFEAVGIDRTHRHYYWKRFYDRITKLDAVRSDCTEAINLCVLIGGGVARTSRGSGDSYNFHFQCNSNKNAFYNVIYTETQQQFNDCKSDFNSTFSNFSVQMAHVLEVITLKLDLMNSNVNDKFNILDTKSDGISEEVKNIQNGIIA